MVSPIATASKFIVDELGSVVSLGQQPESPVLVFGPEVQLITAGTNIDKLRVVVVFGFAVFQISFHTNVVANDALRLLDNLRFHLCTCLALRQ